MNRTKFFAFIAAFAMIFACGSQDESGVTPKLENSGVNRISPYDTLVAKFNSTIVDIDKLGIENIVNTPNSSNVIKLVGTYGTTPGGAPFFEPNQDNAIVFSNLKNSDGKTAEKESIEYFTYSRLDIEPNNTKEDASEANLDPNKVIIAGILDHENKLESGLYDMKDYYKINLQASDTLYITVSNFRDDLTIKIAEGPTYSADSTYSVKKGATNKFKYPVGAEILHEPKPEYSFYIIVSDNNANSPPNPYTIHVERIKMGGLQ